MTTQLHLVETAEDRHARGAYFTPRPIAEFLANWAIGKRVNAIVLDPTCGDGVFLEAAARRLMSLGVAPESVDSHLVGVDIHQPSLDESQRGLRALGADARFVASDFFALDPPDALLPTFPPFNAIVGNPPFIRYQQHTGDARRLSAAAALRQGVRLSGLASSWAALLVHAGSFLAPDGRLAMVLPAELLTVGYAEPVRQWLRRRFGAVKLVLFERRQFADALEHVVLLLAEGTGGCEAFSLYHVTDAEDLERIEPLDVRAVAPSVDGKWTDMLLSIPQRHLFRTVAADHFTALNAYGAPELGTVTGSNAFFTLNESTRVQYRLEEGAHVVRVSPPGTRHLRGLSFTRANWEALRLADEPVWILNPTEKLKAPGLARYVALGELQGVDQAYKCQVRSPWWRPPVVSTPDLFFTYMSHRYPRMISNKSGATFVNSMHGIRLRDAAPPITRDALPLLALNSVTMLGAEVFGRSYGGGILKMEPREARTLPVPAPEILEKAWSLLRSEKGRLNRLLRDGLWTTVLARVDQVVLREVLGLSAEDSGVLHDAALALRTRRLGRQLVGE